MLSPHALLARVKQLNHLPQASYRNVYPYLASPPNRNHKSLFLGPTQRPFSLIKRPTTTTREVRWLLMASVHFSLNYPKLELEQVGARQLAMIPRLLAAHPSLLQVGARWCGHKLMSFGDASGKAEQW